MADEPAPGDDSPHVYEGPDCFHCMVLDLAGFMLSTGTFDAPHIVSKLAEALADLAVAFEPHAGAADALMGELSAMMPDLVSKARTRLTTHRAGAAMGPSQGCA